MNEVCCFLSPSILISFSEKDKMEYSQNIQLKNCKDLSIELSKQLLMLVFMTTIKYELAKLNSIKEILEFLTIQLLLTSSVPEVATTLVLFITISLISANAKRSFSKLKFIKKWFNRLTAKPIFVKFVHPAMRSISGSHLNAQNNFLDLFGDLTYSSF
jgi:hypothetical protein